MVDDLLIGRVTSFRREQGFGVITLDDGRDVKFDASNCTMIPEEGAVVRLRVGPAKWGGGFKALHVEPRGSSTLFVPADPPSLDQQIAALQREHLVGALSEHVMAQLATEVLGGTLDDAVLIDVIDAYYAQDRARTQHDGYLRCDPPDAASADLLAKLAALVPGAAIARELAAGAESPEALVDLVNDALRAADDPRRVYELETGASWRSYLVLAPDRAQRLSNVLPFVTAPQPID
jgi:cold shock CspA family protein